MALAKNVETLKNMNGSSGKVAKWYVRILDPQIVCYTFAAKGETVNAERFECVIVSKEPSQFMLGSVPFDFADRQAASKALAKFQQDSVWEITTPAFDTRARPEYNGCVLKSVLLLKKPTVVKQVPPTNTVELRYPAPGVEITLDLPGIMGALGKQPSGSGSAKPISRTFSFSGKFLHISGQNNVEKDGKRYKVAAAEFVDSSGGKVTASVWQEAYKLLAGLPEGQGVAVIGVAAKTEKGEVKLNIWPGTHVSITGSQVAALSELDISGVPTKELTATFVPGEDLDTLVEQPAHTTCAAALSDAVARNGPIVFQINRCHLDAPSQAELIFNQSGRAFIKACRLRDRSGGVDVDVVRGAVPSLYGVVNEEQLRARVEAQALPGFTGRLNVRGVLREENGVTRKYIVQVERTPLKTTVSSSAMRLALGLSTIGQDGVLAAPAERLVDDAMLGLSLRRDSDEPLGAFRVLLLVQGTEDTVCDPIDDKVPAQEQLYKVTSAKVKCLLSEGETFVTLQGYSDFKKIMAYRLDSETALVLASAISCSPSESGEACVVTVEHMQKVSEDQKGALVTSMGQEWKSVLTNEMREGQVTESPAASSKTAEYWSEERAPKLRRLQSEPQSPGPASAAAEAK